MFRKAVAHLGAGPNLHFEDFRSADRDGKIGESQADEAVAPTLRGGFLPPKGDFPAAVPVSQGTERMEAVLGGKRNSPFLNLLQSSTRTCVPFRFEHLFGSKTGF